MRSHIVLPRSSLTRFATNGSLTYLDLRSNQIKKAILKIFVYKKTIIHRKLRIFYQGNWKEKLGYYIND